MGNFDDYFYLGKIVKEHGYEGKVSVYFDTDEPQSYENIDMVFINIAGSLVPYFVSSLSLLNNKAVVSFMDVDTAEKANALINKELYLPTSLLPKLKGNKFYYHEVKGMMVIDSSYGKLGKIYAVLEYPNQAVLQLFVNEKEVLIPISNDIILNIDRDKNIMDITAPDGLLDVYLK